MEVINNFLANYNSILIMLMSVLICAFIVLTFINIYKLDKVNERFDKIVNEIDGHDLEKTILNYYDVINEIARKNKDMQQTIQKIEGNLALCIQKVGVVRYNAFEDVGSDLSFAVAMLDSNDNGFILNGIYSRESSTTYSKPVIGGKSKYPLSAEEIQALDLAKKNYEQRMYLSK